MSDNKALVAKTVNDLWMETCKGVVPPALAKKWWHVLKYHYEEGHRHYHTLAHIYEMCKYWNEHKHQLRAPKEVFFAILFHDVIYDTKAIDNEQRSAELFMDFAKECIDEKSCINAGNIYHMILLTKDHQTDAHFNPDKFGNEDVHYFLDMDMAILGQTHDEYDKYASKIRLEFHHIEESVFHQRRAQVLTTFLKIPKIFCTKEFHDRYETQAKENLKQEISFCTNTY